jgi:co-chaperonin GroES (HSP10)
MAAIKNAGIYDGDTFCERQIGVDLDIPGWFILVRAPIFNEMTAGGIIVPSEVKEAEVIRDTLGLVLKIGDQCFTGADYESYTKPPCEVGDWIYYSSFEKQVLNLNGYICYTVTDKKHRATVPKKFESIILANKH